MDRQFVQYNISLFRDVPFGVYLGLLSILVIGTLTALVVLGIRRSMRFLSTLLLIEYVVFIYCATLLFRTTTQELKYNFQPFWSYRAILNGEDLLIENVMNVVVFLPLGFLLGIVFRSITWWQVLCVGSMLSVSIEVLQYLTQHGFAETDDVMHNTLGCIIGYGIISLTRKIIK